jgi:hypothetical protein
MGVDEERRRVVGIIFSQPETSPTGFHTVFQLDHVGLVNPARLRLNFLHRQEIRGEGLVSSGLHHSTQIALSAEARHLELRPSKDGFHQGLGDAAFDVVKIYRACRHFN